MAALLAQSTSTPLCFFEETKATKGEIFADGSEITLVFVAEVSLDSLICMRRNIPNCKSLHTRDAFNICEAVIG